MKYVSLLTLYFAINSAVCIMLIEKTWWNGGTISANLLWSGRYGCTKPWLWLHHWNAIHLNKQSCFTMAVDLYPVHFFDLNFTCAFHICCTHTHIKLLICTGACVIIFANLCTIRVNKEYIATVMPICSRLIVSCCGLGLCSLPQIFSRLPPRHLGTA